MDNFGDLAGAELEGAELEGAELEGAGVFKANGGSNMRKPPMDGLDPLLTPNRGIHIDVHCVTGWRSVVHSHVTSLVVAIVRLGVSVLLGVTLISRFFLF